MSPNIHKVYIASMVLTGSLVTLYLAYTGFSYYNLPLEERFYHPRYDWFKPSGTLGHGLGIIGTLMILFGVSIYIARKRYGFLEKYIRIKHLLEFHIFLCSLGPILVLFHTSFKFGGIVSIAFWSMVAVVLSGVIGRFIYIQIPRNVAGRELSNAEVENQINNIKSILQEKIDFKDIEEHFLRLNNLSGFSPLAGLKSNTIYHKIKSTLKRSGRSTEEVELLVKNLRQAVSLNRKLKKLDQMKKLFRYWHVAHLPFALIMLIIVVIHVVITLALGYKWIF